MFVDAVQEKETRKEDDSKQPDDRSEEEMKVEDLTLESLPEKPSETMEPDFDPDDEEMAEVPLPDLHASPTDKDISLGAKPKSSPTPRPSLETFVRRKSLLVADGADSDSAAPRALPPALVDTLPSHSRLRGSSRGKSRAPSKSRGQSRGRTEDRSQSRASPERRILDGKACIVTVSGNAGTAARPLPSSAPRALQPPLQWMPEDASSLFFRDDFLRWTALSLQRDWSGDSRRWPNVHIGLYLYESSAEWPCAHPRCLAAGFVGPASNRQAPTHMRRHLGPLKLT